MMKINRAFAIIFSILTIFCLFSCSKTSGKWKPESGHVAVLFGYGYNDDEFVASTENFLSEKFGLEENNGLIVPLVYPDDFPSVGERAKRMLSLSSVIEDKNCKVLITLGAPDYTHKALAKIQDAELDCFVISLFSQDDLMGTEAGSNIVIDFVEPEKNQDSEIEFNVETSVQHLDKMNSILEKTIKTVIPENQFLISSNAEVIQKAFGSDWQVASFVDPQTALKSRNHFVLKFKGKAVNKKKGKISK